MKRVKHGETHNFFPIEKVFFLKYIIERENLNLMPPILDKIYAS